MSPPMTRSSRRCSRRAAVGERGAARRAARGRDAGASSGTSAGRTRCARCPYLKAWHERYARARAARRSGALPRLRRRRATSTAVREAVARLGIELPGAARQRASRCGRSTRTRAGRRATCSTAARALFDYHYGEGAYAETELAIGELLGVRARAAARRCAPRTRPARCSRAQTEDRPAPYSRPLRGRRRVGGARRPRDGAGERRSTAPTAARARRSTHPGAYLLIEHDAPHRGRARRSSSARACACEATCFTPGTGVAPERQPPSRGRCGSARVRAVQQQPLEHGRPGRPRRARTFPASRGSRRDVA